MKCILIIEGPKKSLKDHGFDFESFTKELFEDSNKDIKILLKNENEVRAEYKDSPDIKISFTSEESWKL